jgi:hypothetical protein
LPPSQIQQRQRRRRDPSLEEASEGEVVLEEEDEVPEVLRRLHLKGAAGVEASSLSVGIGASTQCSAAK